MTWEWVRLPLFLLLVNFRIGSRCAPSASLPASRSAFDQGVIINLDDVSLVDALVKARGRCPDLISFRLNPVRAHCSIV